MPLPGAHSFAQEALNTWREKHSTEHWNDLSKEINDPLQSYELFVLHHEQVCACLARCAPKAAVPPRHHLECPVAGGLLACTPAQPA